MNIKILRLGGIILIILLGLIVISNNMTKAVGNHTVLDPKDLKFSSIDNLKSLMSIIVLNQTNITLPPEKHGYIHWPVEFREGDKVRIYVKSEWGNLYLFTRSNYDKFVEFEASGLGVKEYLALNMSKNYFGETTIIQDISKTGEYVILHTGSDYIEQILVEVLNRNAAASNNQSQPTFVIDISFIDRLIINISNLPIEIKISIISLAAFSIAIIFYYRKTSR